MYLRIIKGGRRCPWRHERTVDFATRWPHEAVSKGLGAPANSARAARSGVCIIVAAHVSIESSGCSTGVRSFRDSGAILSFRVGTYTAFSACLNLSGACSGSTRCSSHPAAVLPCLAASLVVNRHNATMPMPCGFLGVFKAQHAMACCGCYCVGNA